jgi:hypothetical protein
LKERDVTMKEKEVAPRTVSLAIETSFVKEETWTIPQPALNPLSGKSRLLLSLLDK